MRVGAVESLFELWSSSEGARNDARLYISMILEAFLKPKTYAERLSEPRHLPTMLKLAKTGLSSSVSEIQDALTQNGLLLIDVVDRGGAMRDIHSGFLRLLIPF